MAITPEQFLERLALALGAEARETARPSIPSRTLADSMQLILREGGIDVYIPYYWALYVHDGRGSFRMPPGKFMVWFRDPKQDPRLSGGYPMRVSERQHLSAEEFHDLLEQNRAAELATYGRPRRAGEPQVGPVIITNLIRNKTPGKPFFANEGGGGMAGFDEKASQIGEAQMRSFVREMMGDLLNVKKTATAKI